ncbi:MAG: hypothetical protein R3Y13_02765 [bacterium]
MKKVIANNNNVILLPESLHKKYEKEEFKDPFIGALLEKIPPEHIKPGYGYVGEKTTESYDLIVVDAEFQRRMEEESRRIKNLLIADRIQTRKEEEEELLKNKLFFEKTITKLDELKSSLSFSIKKVDLKKLKNKGYNLSKVEERIKKQINIITEELNEYNRTVVKPSTAAATKVVFDTTLDSIDNMIEHFITFMSDLKALNTDIIKPGTHMFIKDVKKTLNKFKSDVKKSSKNSNFTIEKLDESKKSEFEKVKYNFSQNVEFFYIDIIANTTFVVNSIKRSTKEMAKKFEEKRIIKEAELIRKEAEAKKAAAIKREEKVVLKETTAVRKAEELKNKEEIKATKMKEAEVLKANAKIAKEKALVLKKVEADKKAAHRFNQKQLRKLNFETKVKQVKEAFAKFIETQKEKSIVKAQLKLEKKEILEFQKLEDDLLKKEKLNLKKEEKEKEKNLKARALLRKKQENERMAAAKVHQRNIKTTKNKKELRRLRMKAVSDSKNFYMLMLANLSFCGKTVKDNLVSSYNNLKEKFTRDEPEDEFYQKYKSLIKKDEFISELTDKIDSKNVKVGYGYSVSELENCAGKFLPNEDFSAISEEFNKKFHALYEAEKKQAEIDAINDELEEEQFQIDMKEFYDNILAKIKFIDVEKSKENLDKLDEKLSTYDNEYYEYLKEAAVICKEVLFYGYQNAKPYTTQKIEEVKEYSKPFVDENIKPFVDESVKPFVEKNVVPFVNDKVKPLVKTGADKFKETFKEDKKAVVANGKICALKVSAHNLKILLSKGSFSESARVISDGYGSVEKLKKKNIDYVAYDPLKLTKSDLKKLLNMKKLVLLELDKLNATKKQMTYERKRLQKVV